MRKQVKGNIFALKKCCYVLGGCVPPLLEVALHIGSPLLSMLCIMSPCCTLQLYMYQVVSLSPTLSSSSSSALSSSPLGHSLCPAIDIKSDYMPSLFPPLFQFKLDYVLHACSFSYFCAWYFVFNFQLQHLSLHGSLGCSQPLAHHFCQ
ncbi:hypothetical protein ElyMa_004731400 [Elysia marginata]|uniref:Uncharacterized protein n=1 Tax=Elysia marginata TaxID=1093978 RepID=A0AAV4IFU5_9GAST|nr:hypothetical protein ElyMa_004731400 [Elysia marginata]